MARLCTNWLETYLAYTSFQEAPDSFHTWVGLSILASTIQRNVKLPRGYFKIFPNLYVALVGPTGFSKTSAADIGINLLEQLKSADVMKEKLTSWFLLDHFDRLTKSKGACCVSIYAPEMKTLLGDLNKTELVTLLTSFYGCPDSPAYRTKGGGTLKFKDVCINLLACSTPEWLTFGTTTDEIAGGFTGRFVYVYQDSTTRSFPFPEDYFTQSTKDQRTQLISDLQHIASLKGDFILTDQAKAEYIHWYTHRQEECRDERLIGYYARKRDLIFKVAMLVALAQDDNLVIDEDILKTTFTLLNQLESTMSEAFAGIVDDPVLKYKDYIVSQIAREPELSIARSQLLRRNWNKFDGVVLDRIITNLVDSRVIRLGRANVKGQSDVAYHLLDARRY